VPVLIFEEPALTTDTHFSDLLSLAGQGFVVLGAGQGMGELTVAALSSQGASVLCVDIDAAAAQCVALVFMDSIAGSAVRSGRMLPYAAAEAALHPLVRGSAKQWAREGMRMNVVAPGLTRTPRLVPANGPGFWAGQSAEIPMGRPREISDVVGESSYVPGGDVGL
jgi:NAD(P)-dependent dehydrogenase (short-subunit alcohol dehydrogenase family)